jgi:hypothetical protein
MWPEEEEGATFLDNQNFSLIIIFLLFFAQAETPHLLRFVLMIYTLYSHISRSGDCGFL